VVVLVSAGAVLVDVADVVVALLLGWVVGEFAGVDVCVDVGVAPRPEAP
jgi:hypothetical protein